MPLVPTKKQIYFLSILYNFFDKRGYTLLRYFSLKGFTMNIIAINTSPRKGKSTYFALNECLKAINDYNKNIKTELIELGNLKINGCIGCGYCKKELNCSQKDDFLAFIPKLADKELKAIIIGSPVYMGSMSSQCKAFLDRTVMFRRNGFLLRNKIGASLAVGGSRNGGQEATIQAIHSAFLIHDMIVVGDGSPNSHFGGTMWNNNGSFAEDQQGLITVKNLGKRVAELVSALK